MVLRPRLLFSLALALAAACGEQARDPAPSPEIVVSLRSDLTPGVELARVDLRLLTARGAPEPLPRVTFGAGDDLLNEPRELLRLSRASLALGEVATTLEVTGRDRQGGRPVVWLTRLAPDVEHVEVRLFRSCRDIRCGRDRPCLAGRCVLQGCLRGDEPSCPPPQCARDADCTASDPICELEGRCDAGLCFARVVGSPCGRGHVCEPGFGCAPNAGAGLGNGAACREDVRCASRVCSGGFCCPETCGPCESCASGFCRPGPGAPSEPGEEICDGLDNDCNGRIDDLAPVSDAHCGACGFACAASETCDGFRCTRDMPCMDALGLPCGEVDAGQLTAPHPHVAMRFGDALDLDADLLVVGAPGDGHLRFGIDSAPGDEAGFDPSGQFGAAYVFRRSGGRWAFEAALRQPATPDGPASLRYGTHVAVQGDCIAVAGGGALSFVHVYTFDGVSWTGPEVEDDGRAARELAFLDDGRLVVLRDGRLEVGEGAGHGGVVRNVSFLRAMEAADTRIAVFDERFGELLVGRPEAALDTVGTTARLPALFLEGDRLYVGATEGAPGESKLSVFGRNPARGWELVQSLGTERAGITALTRVGPWLAVGSPEDPLADTLDPIGADTRLRPGRAGTNGTVYLYRLGDDGTGLPIDGPLYLRAVRPDLGMEFGRTLTSDGEVLFVGAPGDRGTRAGATIPTLSEAGAVYLRRLVAAD